MNQRTRKRVPRRKQTPDFPIESISSRTKAVVWRSGERIMFVDALPGELVTVRVTHNVTDRQRDRASGFGSIAGTSADMSTC